MATLKSKAKVEQRDLWQQTDHVCRDCLGRIYRSVNAAGKYIVRCSNCGAEAVGDHRELCACNANRKTSVFRCRKSEHRTREYPAEIVVTEVRE